MAHLDRGRESDLLCSREGFARAVFNPLVTIPSPLSQFAVFADHLAKERCIERLSEDIACESPFSGSSKGGGVLGTLLLSMFHGQSAFSQISALRLDAENPAMLGMRGAISGARVRRGLDSLCAESAGVRMASHLRGTWENSFTQGWICDAFFTRKANPSRGGAFGYRTLWDNSTGLCLGVDVQDLATDSAGAFFKEFLDSLPHRSLPGLLRGGEDCVGEDVLALADGRKIPYIFELPADWPTADFRRVLESSNDWECGSNGVAVAEGFLRLQDWSRARRVVFLRSLSGKISALVTSLPVGKSEIAKLHFERPVASSPFDPNSGQWPWEAFTTGDAQSSRAAARLLAIFSNWWANCNRGSGAGGLAARFAPSVVVSMERPRRMRVFSLVLVGLVFAVLASGIAVTTNPALDLPPVKALQNLTHSVMELMKPSETYVGEDVIDALAIDQMAPLPDPNVDDMPVLDGERVGAFQPPVEEDGRLWRIRPILSTGVTFDDNIFITNSNRKGDFIFNINAGFALEFGDYRNMEDNYLLLEYLATAFFFNRYTSQNSFDQAASLVGQYRFENLAVQAESRYQSLSGAERQVGAFTDRSIFFNAFRMIYDYSEKTSMDFEANQRTSYYPQNLSSYYYEAKGGFNYALFPKTLIGLEGILGLAQVQESPDMWYQTLNGRLDYAISGKTMVKASGGVQFNEYVGGGEPLRMIPVFSLGAEYLLFTKTRLSLVAYRNLQASASLAGQDYIATGGELGLTQEFASKFEIGVTTGYENDTYVANTTSTDATRVDNFFFIRPSISYNFLKYMKASLSYEYRTNRSDLVEDTWFDNKLNLELEARF